MRTRSRGQRVLAITQRSRHDRGHPDVALHAGDGTRIVAADAVLRLQAGRRRELHVVLTERRQHLVDVPQEDRARPDEEDPLGRELPSVRVEQVRGAVERDRGLPGTRAAGDDQHPGERRPDGLVLLALDRGDDVAHPPGAGPFERSEQRALAEHPQTFGLHRVAVEDLVVDGHQLTTGAQAGEEVPAAHHAHRRHRGRPVERLGDRAPASR